jgi:hypothetical protein
MSNGNTKIRTRENVSAVIYRRKKENDNQQQDERIQVIGDKT